MKGKEYMRGLGVGVLVTAIICAVALPGKSEPVTDAEIIARAKELGYAKAEGSVTAEDINKIKENGKLTGTPAVADEQEVTPEGTPEGTPGPTSSPIPTPEPPNPPDTPETPASPTPGAEERPALTVTPKPTATAVPTKSPTDVPKATTLPEPSQTPETISYTITVERGATASRVAEQLEKAGAVSSAAEFVQYLRNEKLTDFINIGTFTIPRGAGYAEIARILTGR